MTLLSIKCFFLLLHVLFCQERDKRVFFKAYLTNFDPIKILLIFFSNKDRNKTIFVLPCSSFFIRKQRKKKKNERFLIFFFFFGLSLFEFCALI